MHSILYVYSACLIAMQFKKSEKKIKKYKKNSKKLTIFNIIFIQFVSAFNMKNGLQPQEK